MPAGFNRVPPPVYQAATQGFQYGFHLPDSGKQHKQDNATTACHGKVVDPRSHGGFAAPQIHGGFVAPMSYGGSAIPSSHGGSVVSTSHGGSAAPSSCGGSVSPTSHGGSTAPSSHSASVVPGPHTASSGMVSGSHDRLTTTCVLPGSQSYPSHQVSSTTCNIASQPWASSDTPPSHEYDFEKSQTSNHWYYDQAPTKDNRFCFESTQSQQPSGDTMSLQCILLLTHI